MLGKRLTQILLLSAILCTLTFSSPLNAQAQENALCGYFQDDGYFFYTFYPYNGYEPLPSNYSADNFESTFGFPIDSGIVWVTLYNPWINRGGSLTGFDNFSIVDSCSGYSEPTPAPVMEFHVDDATITLGECTTLRWTTNEVYEQVFLDSTNGPVFSTGEGRAPASGEAAVCPSGNSTYRLTGAYGITQDYREITIYVFEPTDTPVPPTRVPTRTSIPPTRTPVPTFTSVPPSPKPISTLVVPPPAPQENKLELSIFPVNQHLSPAVILSNGLPDNGEFDCFVASMSMALDYFRGKDILDASDTSDYRSLVPIVRGTTPPGAPLTADPAFVSTVTNGKLSARPWYTPPENLAAAIETELKAGRPVVTSVPNWNLLAARWAGNMPHAIIIYGLHDGRVYYVDPWDGNRYDMPIQGFVDVSGWRDGSFLITFTTTPE
ncbi:MAG: papain-like cysteine protease family protein [Anaerolineales bacterium]